MVTMDKMKLILPVSMDKVQNAAPPLLPAKQIHVRNPKALLILIVVLFAIALSFLVWKLTPPNPDVLYETPLSEREKANIRSSLAKKGQFLRWDYVDPYYGTINNCVIFVFHPKKPLQSVWKQQISDYIFEWDSSIVLYAYRKNSYDGGTICELGAAYLKGWLTKEHIETIYQKHNQYRIDFPAMLEEWTKSQEEGLKET